MTYIEFGELPSGNTGGRPAGTGKWATIAAELRARPGEWAKVTTLGTQSAAHSAASNARRGYYAAMPAGDFEAAVRGCDVWVRYIGRAA